MFSPRRGILEAMAGTSRRIQVWPALSTTLMWLGVPVAWAQPGNILLNPGFEDGLTGWTIVNPGNVAITTATVHSGNRALQFTVGTFSGTMALQSFPLRSGTITELSFWCRVDPSPGASYQIDITTKPGGGLGASRSITNLTPGQWTFFELSQFYLTPTFSELRFYFVTQGTSTQGTRVYLDDVRLVPTPSAGGVGIGCVAVASFRRRRRSA